MKFIVTYVGGGAKAFPLGNLAELAQAKEALRSARQKTAQVYRGNPHDPSTWRREGRLTAAPPKKANTARRPARSARRKGNGPNATFAVVEPIGGTSRGLVRSVHRSAEAAQQAIDRELAAVRRRPGSSSAWVERAITRVPAGTKVRANVIVRG